LERLTVSLPGDLVRKVKRISEESGLKISRIVAAALEQHLSEQVPPRAESPIHPTILWKLKGRKMLTGPSPRLMRARVGSWRIIDLDELPV
jgi:hypothetical protein